MRRGTRKDLYTLDLFAGMKDEKEKPLEIALNLNFLDLKKIELRPYEVSAHYAICDGRNYGLVMETGLGKTFVAFMAMDRWLSRGRVLFCAPQKPLCRQHYEDILDFFKIAEDEVAMITGQISKKMRKKIWQGARIIVGTPQTICEEIKSSELSLMNFAGIVLDEIHHAVEKYAYIEIARLAKSSGLQILGLTASPASSEEKVEKIRQNLQLDGWLDLTVKDESLRLFQYPKKHERRVIHLDEPLRLLEEKVKRALLFFWQMLIDLGIEVRSKEFFYLAEEELKIIHGQIKRQANTDKSRFFAAIKCYAALYKLYRAYQYLVAENYQTFLTYLSDLEENDETKGALMILNHPEINEAKKIAKEYVQSGILHPKLKEYLKIIQEEIRLQHTILVFCRYIASSKTLCKLTSDLEIDSRSLIGQSEMPQKAQKAVIADFKEGKFPVLISTAIGQEGLHLPQVDTVIEYSVPQTEIEMKQRHGRCGRKKPGHIHSLVMEHPIDQVLFWASLSKKRRMEKTLALRGKAPDHLALRDAKMTRSPFSAKPKKTTGFVDSLAPGLIFERFCAVNLEPRVSKSGNHFVSMILGDKSGVIKGYVWCEEARQTQELCAKIKSGSIVIASGWVSEFEGKLNISIDPSRGQFVEICPESDFSLEDFVRKSKSDPIEHWQKIERAISEIRNAFLKNLLVNIFKDSETKEKFKSCPAAVLHHHNQEAGLLEHVIEMLEMAEFLLPGLGMVVDDLVTSGIILHDLGKTKTYRMNILAEVMPEERNPGHIALGLSMIESAIKKIPDFPYFLSSSLLHIIRTHHGEASDVKPQTPEAKMVAMIDDFNAKVKKISQGVEKISKASPIPILQILPFVNK